MRQVMLLYIADVEGLMEEDRCGNAQDLKLLSTLDVLTLTFTAIQYKIVEISETFNNSTSRRQDKEIVYENGTNPN